MAFWKKKKKEKTHLRLALRWQAPLETLGRCGGCSWFLIGCLFTVSPRGHDINESDGSEQPTSQDGWKNWRHDTEMIYLFIFHPCCFFFLKNSCFLRALLTPSRSLSPSLALLRGLFRWRRWHAAKFSVGASAPPVAAVTADAAPRWGRCQSASWLQAFREKKKKKNPAAGVALAWWY